MEMIKVLGWVCTALIITGFLLNAEKKYTYAIIIWIVGDIGWIVYDYFIDNYSHAVLSAFIIIINIRGLQNLRKKVMSTRLINKISQELFQ